MGHTPFGYRIEDGKAVVDDKAAEQVKELFFRLLVRIIFEECCNKSWDRLLPCHSK